MKGNCAAIIGLQWGDEGKGKLVDSIVEDYDIACRYQGGANAGHTVIYNGNKVALHLIPSGIFHPEVTTLIGNGTVIDIVQLLDEIKSIESLGINVKDRLKISKRAHLILPHHFEEENNTKMRETIGTTGKGIGPAYSDKMSRKGLRMESIFSPDILENRGVGNDYMDVLERFGNEYGELVQDTVLYLNEELEAGKNILFEGAQGILLDIDFGTYPYVTSSNPSPGGIFTGAGIPPNSVGRIIGVMKAYTTRVGRGPFPPRMERKLEGELRDSGDEYGATTGRPRKCGWIDLVSLKYSITISGISEIALTKVDVLDGFSEVKAVVEYEIDGEKTNDFPPESWKLEKAKPIYRSFKGWDKTAGISKYEELPEKLRDFISFLEEFLGKKIKLISTGKKRGDLIRV